MFHANINIEIIIGVIIALIYLIINRNMLINMLSEIQIIFFMSAIIFAVLHYTLKLNNNEKIRTTLLLVTGLYLLIGFYSRIKENFEEPKKEVNRVTSINNALDKVMVENETTQQKKDLLTNDKEVEISSSDKSVVITKLSSDGDAKEINNVIKNNQMNIEETTAIISKPVEKTRVDTQKFKIKSKKVDDLQSKYTILPIDQWMKPDYITQINLPSCQCPTIAPWTGSYLEY
jgi:virulence-associated protein VagC